MVTGTVIMPFATKRYLKDEEKGFQTNGEKVASLAKHYSFPAICTIGGAACSLTGCYRQHNEVKTLKQNLAVTTTALAASTSIVNGYEKFIESKEGVKAAKDIRDKIIETSPPRTVEVPHVVGDIPQHIDLHTVYECRDRFGMRWYSSYYQLLIDLVHINDDLAKSINEYVSLGDWYATVKADAEDIWNNPASDGYGFNRNDGWVEIDLPNIVCVDEDTGEMYLNIKYKNGPTTDYKRYF